MFFISGSSIFRSLLGTVISFKSDFDGAGFAAGAGGGITDS